MHDFFIRPVALLITPASTDKDRSAGSLYALATGLVRMFEKIALTHGEG